MARQRMLHPGYFTDGKVCSLPPLARLLFQGLWCEADREGRLRDRPVDLKIRYLPVDNCDIGALLGELAEAGLIHRYEVGGEKYIAVSNFSRYQHPHANEKPSGIPGPLVNTSEVLPKSVGSASEVLPKHSGANRAESVTVTESVTESIKTRVEKPSENPDGVAAMGGLSVPALAQAAQPGRRAGDTPSLKSQGQGVDEDLEAGIKRIWLKKRGVPWAWRSAHELELRPAFDLAEGNVREVLRVFESALDCTYPKLVKLSDLAKHWNAYAATKGPEPGRNSKSPVAAESVPREAFAQTGVVDDF